MAFVSKFGNSTIFETLKENAFVVLYKLIDKSLTKMKRTKERIRTDDGINR